MAQNAIPALDPGQHAAAGRGLRRPARQWRAQPGPVQLQPHGGAAASTLCRICAWPTSAHSGGWRPGRRRAGKLRKALEITPNLAAGPARPGQPPAMAASKPWMQALAIARTVQAPPWRWAAGFHPRRRDPGPQAAPGDKQPSTPIVAGAQRRSTVPAGRVARTARLQSARQHRMLTTALAADR